MRCKICDKEKILSSSLPVCSVCIRERKEDAAPFIEKAHRRGRESFRLPLHPPRAGKKSCRFCINECRGEEGERGFCNVREWKSGKNYLLPRVSFYHDPLPTNCVADWVCAGGTGAGWPHFSYSSKGPEYGYKNLAVFYEGCSFDCLFCQNWHYKIGRHTCSASSIAEAVDRYTSCICFFGGDPAPFMPHALAAASLARKKKKGEILRICFETNGSMSRASLLAASRIVLESGGCIKFDIKAFDENLNKALCGVSNKWTLDNFAFLATFIKERREPPFLIASTLLVPGYIDEEEIEKIAHFIASVNPEIPWSLLAYSPQFLMKDLPYTSRDFAKRCLDIARKYGILHTKIGNVHLLK